MTTTSAEVLPGSPVFCAGPMFSKEDRRMQKRIAKELKRAGYETYLAQKNGVEVAGVMRTVTQGINLPLAQVNNVIQLTRKLVFAVDIYQAVERCRSLVLNVDGRVPDEGSAVEASIAYALCKPVVIFKTTPVTMLGGFDSPMIDGLSGNWTTESKLWRLPATLSAAVATRPQSPTVPACEHLEAVCKLGAAVWANIDVIQQAPAMEPDKMYELVQRLEAQWADLLSAAFG